MESFKFLTPREARMAVGALARGAPGAFDRPVAQAAALAVDGGLILDLAELEEEAREPRRGPPVRLDVRWPGEWRAACGEGPSELVPTLGGRFYAVSPSGSMRTEEVRAAEVAEFLDRRGTILRVWKEAAEGGWAAAVSAALRCGPVSAGVDVPYSPTPRQRRLAMDAAAAVYHALRRDRRLRPAEAEAAANGALGGSAWRAVAVGLENGAMAVVITPWSQNKRGGK